MPDFTMQYRRLGASNLNVSTLCLGTMMFADQTDEAEAARIVASARDHGVNFIDTADVYSKGGSEQMVGRLLIADRHDWVLATKLGNPMGSGPNQSNYSRTWILREVEDSLRRLATDYVDILYLHRDFTGANLEEPVRAMGDLIRAGKIRYWAVSNFRGWRIAEIASLCDRLGVPRPVACQPYYNLLNRMPEVEILPACEHFGLGVVPYSPIARGVLTGKYLPGQKPDADSRAGRADRRMMETEFREESLVIAQQLKAHAEGRGLTPGQFATAWVLANPIISSVIAGPRTLAQFEDYFGAVNVAISAQEEALVDGLVPRGHASTHGYTDPNYPFGGRPVASA
ncbi:1-deoxyxylulose-5-phosphate synthase YajO [Cupriavidus campinensis]|uniref:Aldo/keto reductase n=1 Tax=Cupriavidus campinensis TaxID=151783 RepID=A0AAE9I3Q9_9BURK|nr:MULTISPECIES: aldo/keto reductase [Cupriavidus]TSP09378.1 aldo/keto reductase [Cupriavidus campinensis]URF07174.1 aldo/keto reductase [Cupriavidus campinensis]CAG2148028.1 1-deoxyxylulose-5-phosphate synthase YajO [Cupriavidus campinensis]